MVAWLGIGCRPATTSVPLADGFYLQADRGSSLRVMQISSGRQIVVDGSFERKSITNARSLFRVTTKDCGVMDFVFKPGDEVECENCASLATAGGASCPLDISALPRHWEYLPH